MPELHDIRFLCLISCKSMVKSQMLKYFILFKRCSEGRGEKPSILLQLAVADFTCATKIIERSLARFCDHLTGKDRDVAALRETSLLVNSIRPPAVLAVCLGLCI